MIFDAVPICYLNLNLRSNLATLHTPANAFNESGTKIFAADQ